MEKREPHRRTRTTEYKTPDLGMVQSNAIGLNVQIGGNLKYNYKSTCNIHRFNYSVELKHFRVTLFKGLISLPVLGK